MSIVQTEWAKPHDKVAFVCQFIMKERAAVSLEIGYEDLWHCSEYTKKAAIKAMKASFMDLIETTSTPTDWTVVNPVLVIDLGDATQNFSSNSNWSLVDIAIPAGSVTAGGSVNVMAEDNANVRVLSELKVSSVVNNNIDGFAALAESQLQKEYIYTTKSGERVMELGDLIRIASDGPASHAGKVFRYLGVDFTTIDLGALVEGGGINNLNLSNSAVWENISGNTDVSDAFPNFGNLANSDSHAYGGIIVTNDVRGTVLARINDVAVTAGTNVSVIATCPYST